MKVALIARSTLFSTPGGDSTQVIQTARELVKLGIEAEIRLAGERIDYASYDLLHLFNIIRPADHLCHIHKSRKPCVLSPIYLDYSEFDRSERPVYQRFIISILGKYGSEYVKNLVRFARRQDIMASPSYLAGHKRAMRELLRNSRLLLPNSPSEYNRLSEDLGISKPYQVITNGVDKELFGETPATTRLDDHVLCVGQIYGRKNQHRLIEACNQLGVSLSVVGKAPPNHSGYLEYCRKIAGPKVRFYDFMPQDQLRAHYASAKVHALPSWFETTGLSSLEAGAMGCNLVVGKDGDTMHYFEGIASFCEAGNMESIRKAVEEALNKACNPQVRDHILEHHTWQRAAAETLAAYQKALGIE